MCTNSMHFFFLLSFPLFFFVCVSIYGNHECRYDVRATLNDISQYEPPPGGYDNRMDYLSPAEQKAEQLCEQERYFSLYNNDMEEEIYKGNLLRKLFDQNILKNDRLRSLYSFKTNSIFYSIFFFFTEEELKRLKSTIGQIPYSYDQSSDQQLQQSNDNNQSSNIEPNENGKDESDEPYIPNPHFIMPSNMITPDTTKVHAIIEKTAKFISGQGPQMEILIKAKQANNPLFEFLNQSSQLNPYYKHMLQTMKDGKYPEENSRSAAENNDIAYKNSTQYTNDYYNITNLPKVHVPVVKYKPSADCAYTQLISKIKGVPIKTAEDLERLNTPSPTSETAPNSINGQSTSNTIIPKKDVEVKKISSALMLAQYYGTDSESENENENNDDDNDKTELPQTNTPMKIDEDSQSSQSNIDTTPIPADIQCPPSDQKIIIDKTAAYVLKNGKDFEQILRTKDDKRFSFLNFTDPYHKYYIYKVTGAVAPTIEPSKINLQQKSTSNNSQSASMAYASSKIMSKFYVNSLIFYFWIHSNFAIFFLNFSAPVSFSIRTKDESAPVLPVKPALPVEHSSDDEDDDKKCNRKESKHTTNTVSSDCLALIGSRSKPFYSVPDSIRNGQTRQSHQTHAVMEVEQSDSFIRDSMLEQNTIDDKMEKKRGDEKVKNRLAQIAREKLGVVSKQKQLQLERKKRAMAFLNQITCK